MRRRTRDGVLLMILLLAGVILGTVVGDLLGSRIPALALLAQSREVALAPSLDLGVISLSAGLRLSVNLLGALGALVGMILWWRR